MTPLTPTELARQLNPPQLHAVTHTEGPLLIFAGAGSGKTRVITFRAAYLVATRGVDPRNVGCVTFTNKASREMRERLDKILGAERAAELWVSTFHATGARTLRRYADKVGLAPGFAIYDDADQRSVLKQVLETLHIDEELLAPRDAQMAIDRWKQEAMSPDVALDRAEGEHQARVANVYANYEHVLRSRNAVDFGDLLVRMLNLVESDAGVRAAMQRRFRYLMVDEFQDTNMVQYRLVRALVGPEKNVCVVGDDDQAIYGWRGADVRNIMHFRRDFPGAEVVKLEENYRSTGRILAAANAVISKLEGRESKTLHTRNPAGALLEVLSAHDEREEAQLVARAVESARRGGTALRDMAVFYRINAQSRPIEEALRVAGVPYAIIGGLRFYDRAEVKDVLAWLRVATSPADDLALLRALQNPSRRLGKTTFDRLTAHARSLGTNVWTALTQHPLPADVAAAARSRLREVVALVQGLAAAAITLAARPSELATLVLERSGYLQALRDDKAPEAETRMENVRELLGSLAAYEREAREPSLTEFLERVSLAEEAPTERGSAERLSLMTVHSAKGLEFDMVMVTGMEDGMFPYKGLNPGDDPEQLHEERRLAYVAITRARRRLVLSCVRFRQLFGNTRAGAPSRFLREIPGELLTNMPSVRRLDDGPSPSFSPRREGDRVEVRVVPGAAAPAAVSVDRDGAPRGYRSGMQVRHARFGVGRVELVEAGSDVKLTVYFPSLGGRKRVLADFVSPA